MPKWSMVINWLTRRLHVISSATTVVTSELNESFCTLKEGVLWIFKHHPLHVRTPSSESIESQYRIGIFWFLVTMSKCLRCIIYGPSSSGLSTLALPPPPTHNANWIAEGFDAGGGSRWKCCVAFHLNYYWYVRLLVRFVASPLPPLLLLMVCSVVV